MKNIWCIIRWFFGLRNARRMLEFNSWTSTKASTFFFWVLKIILWDTQMSWVGKVFIINHADLSRWIRFSHCRYHILVMRNHCNVLMMILSAGNMDHNLTKALTEISYPLARTQNIFLYQVSGQHTLLSNTSSLISFEKRHCYRLQKVSFYKNKIISRSSRLYLVPNIYLC